MIFKIKNGVLRWAAVFNFLKINYIFCKQESRSNGRRVQREGFPLTSESKLLEQYPEIGANVEFSRHHCK